MIQPFKYFTSNPVENSEKRITKRLISSIVYMLVVLTIAYGQNSASGDLLTHINDIITAMPTGLDGDEYAHPNSSAQATWRRIIQNLLSGAYSTAHSRADSINYQVITFTETTTTPNKTHYILQQKSGSTTNYWGTFIFNPSPLRQKLIIQCPHPINDTNTGEQGLHLYVYCGAKAYFLSGTNRCNSSSYSSCSGTTATCTGSSESYRQSDQAHNVDGTYQITTEEIITSISDAVFIQPHGFSKLESDPDLIFSNGTNSTPSTDHLNTLKTKLLTLDSTLTFKIAHIDNDWTRLVGFTNTQGRKINGESSPCNTSATSSTGRFLHLEQAYSKLRNNETSWTKVTKAISLTFPLDNSIANSQIMQFDGENDYMYYSDDAVLSKLDEALDYTIEAWVYVANESDIDDYDNILCREDGFQLRLRSNRRLNFNIYKGSSTWGSYSSNNNAITVGAWNHVAVIRNTDSDPNTFKMYVNGTDVSSSTWLGSPMQANGGDLYVGRANTDANHYKGYLDEIRIETLAEYPANLRSNTTDSPYSYTYNTAAIFHLDEGSGNYQTSNESGHYARLGDNGDGDSSEPTWRAWNYLFQDLSLPVSLVSFEANVTRANEVRLEWVTESEIENLGFLLERKESGRLDWSEIANYITHQELRGQGNISHRTEYSFIDKTIKLDHTYDYRLADVSYDGAINYHSISILNVVTENLPSTFAVYQNYPNPLNPITTIEYDLPEDCQVKLMIYDNMGREVTTLVSEAQDAGFKSVQWNATNVASGMYFYQIKAGDFISTKKMLVIK